jgi:hypothetical protein
MDYPCEEDVPYRIWGQKVKDQAHWTLKLEKDIGATM